MRHTTGILEQGGTWRLEDDVRAFKGVHDLLCGHDPLTQSEMDHVWFLLQCVIRRLEDTFYILVQEQADLTQKLKRVHKA